MTITLPEPLSRDWEAWALKEGRDPEAEVLAALEKALSARKMVPDRFPMDGSTIPPTAQSWDDFNRLPPVDDDFLADRNQGEYETRLPFP